jgi:hypothetical protein
MVAWFFLGVGLVALILLLLRAYANADPQTLKRVLFALGAALALGIVAIAVATGRAGALFGLAIFLYPLWRNWRAIAARAKAAVGPTPGQTSTVETPWLRLVLDHDSGAMSGRVLQGEFAGRALDDLAEDELRALRQACAADADSARLLDAYLDRRFGGQDFADETGESPAEEPPPRPSATGGMELDEARSILGLHPGAGEEEIRAAHRRLMLKLHPDQGGSDWLAARINQAKDLLLKHARESG